MMIANTMKDRLRDTDVLCRVGGEEFVAICKRADKDNSMQLAESLREIIEKTKINIDTDEVSVTVSIGVATVTKENVLENGDAIFKHADIALYSSKDNGKNRVTHFDDIT